MFEKRGGGGGGGPLKPNHNSDVLKWMCPSCTIVARLLGFISTTVVSHNSTQLCVLPSEWYCQYHTVLTITTPGVS